MLIIIGVNEEDDSCYNVIHITTAVILNGPLDFASYPKYILEKHCELLSAMFQGENFGQG